ncbi:MAG: hypothetical protein KJ626_03960 [Verrucomicrobia bacterium]|nr:hypothetical protein [Verrucomicrobiota bacterium]
MARKRKRNRKKQSAGYVFPTPLAGILVLAAVLALSYLWLCGRCEALGTRILELEKTQEDVHHRYLNEEFKWSVTKSRRNLRRALARHQINMVWPDERHIVRLPQPDDRLIYGSLPVPARQFAQHVGITMND